MRLRLVPPGLLQIEQEDGLVEEWSVEQVQLSARLGSTPRTLHLDGAGYIQCPDTPVLDRWLVGQSSRVEQVVDWLERRRVAIAGAAVAVVLATAGVVHFVLPAAAREGAERMPRSVEKHASEQAVRLLHRMGLEESSLPAARRAELQAGFAALVAGEPRSGEMQLQFASGEGMGPNAFALPDGRIFLTDDIVRLAESDDELLAVLAHEAGHHVHRHGMRQALESSSVFLLAGLLFGDVSGSSLAVSVPAALLSNRFSRGHEREADRFAFALLQKRGKSPHAFASMMERLSAEMPQELETDVVGYLSTHPPTPERVRAAREAAGRPDGGPGGSAGR